MNRHERYADPRYRYGRFANSDPVAGQCRWCVSHDHNSSQCSRKATVDGLWCKQHSPAAAKARGEKQEEGWRQDRLRREAQGRRQDWERHAVEIVRSIAAGGLPDPVAYARAYLDQNPDKQA